MANESIKDLEKKLEDLKEQQKQCEATFHQITGAIAVVDGMIKEKQEGSKTKKSA